MNDDVVQVIELLIRFSFFFKKKLPQTTAALNRLFYINKACLRLLRKYTNEIYPNSYFGRAVTGALRQPMKKPDGEQKTEAQVCKLDMLKLSMDILIRSSYV